MTDQPAIVDVRRDSSADGPGIRTVAFLKGCPLHCSFCHNPETQDPRPEMAFFRARCISCGRCAEACAEQAIDLELPGRIHRDRCQRCGACAEACASGALRLIGVRRSPDELAKILLQDAPFFRNGGGVTLSGGEATMFPEYLDALLRRLRAAGVHVILETSGFFDYGVFSSRILPYLDEVYFDLKPALPAAHLRCTGRDNGAIHENLRRLLAHARIPVLPRAPMIPGLTDTPANLRALAAVLRECGAKRIELLPYNPLGLDMYEALNRPRPRLPDKFPTPEDFAALCASFAALSGC
jgi:pyruvate formate lyase activating enzyme